jgi:4-carboxymuconolactone decarboxylase
VRKERFEKGWKKFKEIHGPVAKATVESLKDISPELGQFVTEFAEVTTPF